MYMLTIPHTTTSLARLRRGATLRPSRSSSRTRLRQCSSATSCPRSNASSTRISRCSGQYPSWTCQRCCLISPTSPTSAGPPLISPPLRRQRCRLSARPLRTPPLLLAFRHLHRRRRRRRHRRRHPTRRVEHLPLLLLRRPSPTARRHLRLRPPSRMARRHLLRHLRRSPQAHRLRRRRRPLPMVHRRRRRRRRLPMARHLRRRRHRPHQMRRRRHRRHHRPQQAVTAAMRRRQRRPTRGCPCSTRSPREQS
mmetsp:Transcript_46376/g.121711  ORF Transcript_46376/g.121711 Transcript_46376/m.121711 type:complete len:252 (-) Transcript_46376:521-1276(-)